jgi:hypothetical protein
MRQFEKFSNYVTCHQAFGRSWGPNRERPPVAALHIRCSPCGPRDRERFCQQVSLWRGRVFGTEGICWSRRAYRVQRGDGPASAVAYVPVTVLTQPKAASGSVLDVANLTR